jgi:hypothetical protein
VDAATGEDLLHCIDELVDDLVDLVVCDPRPAKARYSGSLIPWCFTDRYMPRGRP